MPGTRVSLSVYNSHCFKVLTFANIACNIDGPRYPFSNELIWLHKEPRDVLQKPFNFTTTFTYIKHGWRQDINTSGLRICSQQADVVRATIRILRGYSF